MCTVVVRHEPGTPVRILALRDEDMARDFDEPGRWWPGQPALVGGRDRQAGGSWCVTDVVSGRTGLVLNRPQRPVAAPGAPSRGVLPLLLAAHGSTWAEHVELAGMASFALVLATPTGCSSWAWDGVTLSGGAVEPGTFMVTSGGPEDRREGVYLQRFTEATYPEGWRDLVTERAPADDRAALVVRHEAQGRVFGTVFGQLVQSVPGRLDVFSSRTPWVGSSWVGSSWLDAVFTEPTPTV